MLHLAGYYDFTNKNHPEYERTNVKGTALILKYAAELNIKRFIFASSLTVSAFGKQGPVLNENSPADASFPYAKSKKKGEKLVKKYSKKFPCSVFVVRLYSATGVNMARFMFYSRCGCLTVMIPIF